jgi:hypothetical protein
MARVAAFPAQRERSRRRAARVTTSRRDERDQPLGSDAPARFAFARHWMVGSLRAGPRWRGVRSVDSGRIGIADALRRGIGYGVRNNPGRRADAAVAFTIHRTTSHGWPASHRRFVWAVRARRTPPAATGGRVASCRFVRERTCGCATEQPENAALQRCRGCEADGAARAFARSLDGRFSSSGRAIISRRSAGWLDTDRASERVRGNASREARSRRVPGVGVDRSSRGPSAKDSDRQARRSTDARRAHHN